MSKQTAKKLPKKTAARKAKAAPKKKVAKKTAAKKGPIKISYKKGTNSKYLVDTIGNAQVSIDHVLSLAPKNYLPNKFLYKKNSYPKTVIILQKINELYLIEVGELGSFVFDEEHLASGLLRAQHMFNPMDYFIGLFKNQTYDKRQVKKKLDVSFQDKSPESKAKAEKVLKAAGLL